MVPLNSAPPDFKVVSQVPSRFLRNVCSGPGFAGSFAWVPAATASAAAITRTVSCRMTSSSVGTETPSRPVTVRRLTSWRGSVAHRGIPSKVGRDAADPSGAVVRHALEDHALARGPFDKTLFRVERKGDGV